MRLLSVACRGIVSWARQDVLAHRVGQVRPHPQPRGRLPTHLPYEGNDEMIITVFDNTSCRRHYHMDEFGEDTDC
jgi:hypothetical protein